MILLFQNLDKLADAALNAHPGNQSGYGIALALAIIVAGIFMTLYYMERKSNDTKADKIFEIALLFSKNESNSVNHYARIEERMIEMRQELRELTTEFRTKK